VKEGNWTALPETLIPPLKTGSPEKVGAPAKEGAPEKLGAPENAGLPERVPASAAPFKVGVVRVLLVRV
jgi:hypothetical protein